jgi:hypothetical protein
VQQACFKLGVRERALDDLVIAAGAFDGDETVSNVMLRERGTDVSDSGFQFGTVVLERRGRDENIAIEVGDHELRACFGAVETDDSKVLGADLLNAGMEGAARLVNEQSSLTRADSAFAGFAGCSHEENLSR